MEKTYLESTKKLFTYYKKLGDDAMAQVADEKLFFQPTEDSNSIAIIVQHMAGNMLSRWTDFLTADGEKEWRNRDSEFENDIKNKTELITKWNEGWSCLFKAIESINPENFNTLIYIRNQGHTITEALNRQLAHYPYHIGQIVFIGKMVCHDQWISLSIPKGDSKSYNKEAFSKPKKKGHFTDESLNKKP